MNRMGTLLAAATMLAACQAGSSGDAASTAAATTVAPTAAPQAREWQPEAFSEVSGHTTPLDQMQFLATLKKSEQLYQKQDFETTAEHQARTKDLAQVLAPISPDAEYLFAPRYNDLNYDADTQRYVGQYATDCYEYAFDDGEVACEFGEYTQNVRNFVGQNGFGATAAVTETNGTKVHLMMPKPAARRFRTGQDYRLPNACPVPIAEAKQIGATGLGFGYLFKVTRAGVETGDMDLQDATVQSPESRIFERHGIWAQITGLVCYRRADAKIVSVQRFQ